MDGAGTGERPPRFPIDLLLRLLGDLAALLGAIGRRHLDDALTLARVLSRARVLGAGAAALPLAGVDAGAVHHVAARLALVRARRQRARHDQARRRARDQHPLVHSHSLLLGCRVDHPSGCPSAANEARDRAYAATRRSGSPPNAANGAALEHGGHTIVTSVGVHSVCLSGVIGPPAEMPGTGYTFQRVAPLIIQPPGRAQRSRRAGVGRR